MLIFKSTMMDVGNYGKFYNKGSLLTIAGVAKEAQAQTKRRCTFFFGDDKPAK